MTERTRDSNRSQTIVRVEDALDADDGTELEQSESRRRIVEIDLTALHLLDERCRQNRGVDFQTEAERGDRSQAGADTAVRRSGDGLVQPQFPAPEILAAKGVVAESG